MSLHVYLPLFDYIFLSLYLSLTHARTPLVYSNRVEKPEVHEEKCRWWPLCLYLRSNNNKFPIFMLTLLSFPLNQWQLSAVLFSFVIYTLLSMSTKVCSPQSHIYSPSLLPLIHKVVVILHLQWMQIIPFVNIILIKENIFILTHLHTVLVKYTV